MVQVLNYDQNDTTGSRHDQTLPTWYDMIAEFNLPASSLDDLDESVPQTKLSDTYKCIDSEQITNDDYKQWSRDVSVTEELIRGIASYDLNSTQYPVLLTDTMWWRVSLNQCSCSTSGSVSTWMGDCLWVGKLQYVVSYAGLSIYLNVSWSNHGRTLLDTKPLSQAVICSQEWHWAIKLSWLIKDRTEKPTTAQIHCNSTPWDWWSGWRTWKDGCIGETDVDSDGNDANDRHQRIDPLDSKHGDQTEYRLQRWHRQTGSVMYDDDTDGSLIHCTTNSISITHAVKQYT